jgi:hypothetical protein
VHLCETVAGAEFGGFNVPANGTGQLDGAGRGTFETMWTPTGFGRVTVRCRVAYDAVENGNLGDHKFAVQQAVGNYGPLIGDTFTLFPDKVHAFAIRFTRSGHVVKMGMLANNSSVSARFGLYNTNTDSPPNPTTPVFPPPNPVQLNGRVELAVDHTVSAGDTLFVLINLSSDLVVSHRSVSQQNPDTRTTGMITFPNLVDPWQGHIATLNGDFPVYVAIEPL